MRMSMRSRREYLDTMRQRYRSAKTRLQKTAIIDEVTRNLEYNRKYAIHVLNQSSTGPRTRARRRRKILYLEAMPAIRIVWEALDYPCAERLHPVLVSTAERLAAHGEITLTPQVRAQLGRISRATLARRIARWPSPKARRALPRRRPSSALLKKIPIDRYDWDEKRAGALEADLVEHNGGSSIGHFAYTLTLVDIVSGWSRRRAVLGRGQTGIHRELSRLVSEWPHQHRELSRLVSEWPHQPWGLHSDNGSEFLSNQLYRFAQKQSLHFTRSRPYKKNDHAHVEQKNRVYVREIVGYNRYDTPEEVEWLNTVYACLDTYANLFLPIRKVIAKHRTGSRVKKTYDVARTPLQRLIDAGALDPRTEHRLRRLSDSINPLAMHRKLEELIARGPEATPDSKAAD